MQFSFTSKNKYYEELDNLPKTHCHTAYRDAKNKPEGFN